jgi:vault protein inter-alpha-trypsin-like protein/VWA domain-containing protein
MAGTSVDPLSAFMNARTGSGRAIPLIATHYDVETDAGLAMVSARRTFRNTEAQSIEAVMTFPVPVSGVLFALEARIDDRLLKSVSRRRVLARDAFEDALGRGKTAVLHEELLPGIHMLSVGQLGPGTGLEVIAVWAMPLRQVNGVGHLRIPVTCGQVYGRSGLIDSDELVDGGLPQKATLCVRSVDGTATAPRIDLVNGRGETALNHPIDIEVRGWRPRELKGLAADGRGVSLRIEPAPAATGALNVAVLVDRSGSMGEICTAVAPGMNKHQAVFAGLSTAAETLHPADFVDLYEFDNALTRVGKARDPASFLEVVRRLRPPGGGTEIGAALDGVLSETRDDDVLLITDGKSHALDVQKLARSGRRFVTVLIGEDSLEAGVGYLALISGGDLFIAGDDTPATITAAFGSLRSPHEPVKPAEWPLQRLHTTRGAMRITAEWSASASVKTTLQTRAVAAFAAKLAIPALSEESAAELAAAEGLVTHLTSLVLVDEAGETQETIPSLRKIALMSPHVASFAPDAPEALAHFDCLESPLVVRGGRRRMFGLMPPRLLSRDAVFNAKNPSETSRLPDRLARLGRQIDWDADPDRLASGDLSTLPPAVARELHSIAGLPPVYEFARDRAIDRMVVVIALAAWASRARSRSADRIWKTVFRGCEDLAAKFFAGVA